MYVLLFFTIFVSNKRSYVQKQMFYTYNLVSEKVAAAAKAPPVQEVAVLAAVGPPHPWPWYSIQDTASITK